MVSILVKVARWVFPLIFFLDIFPSYIRLYIRNFHFYCATNRQTERKKKEIWKGAWCCCRHLARSFSFPFGSNLSAVANYRWFVRMCCARRRFLCWSNTQFHTHIAFDILFNPIFPLFARHVNAMQSRNNKRRENKKRNSIKIELERSTTLKTLSHTAEQWMGKANCVFVCF